MIYNFCTFFDKNYLTRGLALYYSLLKHHSDFNLYMLCMDDESFNILNRLNLDKVKLLKASEVEDEHMLAIKNTRTAIEYSWLFGHQLSLYLLENTQIETIGYLDADMYFYESADEIYKEFGDKSIMIIPHNYSLKNKSREKLSGIYNVGMIIFRNDQNSRECLNWWKDRCLEWCYARYEDGKNGDQMYLDNWPTQFKAVHILKHLGADVASWNIDNFEIKQNNQKINIVDKISNKVFDLIFYHFHGLKIYMGNKGEVQAYPITIYNKKIYSIYLEGLQKAYDCVKNIDPNWNYGCVKKIDWLRKIKQQLTFFIFR